MENLIEFYKVARNSVEHFDTLLGDFRKIIFAFNGIVISSAFVFYSNHPGSYMVFFLVNLILALTNIVIWMLEKHYHRYLEASAFVAKNIEKEILKQDTQKMLTHQLGIIGHTRIQGCSPIAALSNFIRSYDLLYILPIMGSLVFNFVLAYLFKAQNWLLICSFVLALFYITTIIDIICFNLKFIRKQEDSLDSGQPKVTLRNVKEPS